MRGLLAYKLPSRTFFLLGELSFWRSALRLRTVYQYIIKYGVLRALLVLPDEFSE